MEIVNPFSFVLVLIYLYFIAFEKNIKSLYIKCLSVSMIIQLFSIMGYFIATGTHLYMYDHVVSVFMFFLSMLLLYKKRRHLGSNKSVFMWLILSVLTIIVINVILLIFVPYNGLVVDASKWAEYTMFGTMVQEYPRFLPNSFIANSVYMLSFFLAVFILKTVYKTEDFLLFFRWADRLFGPYLVLLFIELVLYVGFNAAPLGEFFLLVFGNDFSTIADVVADRDAISAIHGVAREPQHMAYSLMMFMTLTVVYKVILLKAGLSKVDKVKLCSAIVLMICSGAFSSIVYISCFLLFVGLLKSVGMAPYQKALGVTLVIILFIGLSGTVAGLISSGDGYFASKAADTMEVLSLLESEAAQGSGIRNATRILSIYRTMQDTLNVPFFGLGLGVTACHSTWVSIFSNVGLVGLFCWFKFLFAGARYKKLLVMSIYFLPGIMVGLPLWAYAFYVIIIVECCKKETVENGLPGA